MRRLLVFGAIAAISVAGCASGEPSEPPVAEVSVEDVGAIEFPLNPYLNAGGTGFDVERRAIRILFSDCMARFGFTVDMSPVGPGEVDLRARRYGLVDLDEARQNGYNTPLSVDDGSSEVPPEEPRSEAYYAVASGEIEQIRTHNGVEIPDGGCSGEVERILNEGAAALPVDKMMFGQALVIRASNRAEQDSRVVAAFEAWSECMARSGYHYAGPWEANNDPAFDGDVATPAEISVATADVMCKQEVDLVNTWASVEIAYQEQVIEENAEALAELLALLEVRRRNAAEVVEREA